MAVADGTRLCRYIRGTDEAFVHLIKLGRTESGDVAGEFTAAATDQDWLLPDEKELRLVGQQVLPEKHDIIIDADGQKYEVLSPFVGEKVFRASTSHAPGLRIYSKAERK